MITFRAVLVACVALNTAAGAVIKLGTQNYSEGQLIESVAAWEAGSSGDVGPFGAFNGSDFGSPFSAVWTVSFAPQVLAGATTTVGIWDHDSAAPGNQVASFSVDTFDLTALLNAAFNSEGGTQNENNIYTIALPSAALVFLSDGVATFQLTLQGPGLLGASGSCCISSPNNGAGLDFVSLTASIPEPSSLILFGGALAALMLIKSRRSPLRQHAAGSSGGERGRGASH
jgi:hypothetical protein